MTEMTKPTPPNFRRRWWLGVAASAISAGLAAIAYAKQSVNDSNSTKSDTNKPPTKKKAKPDMSNLLETIELESAPQPTVAIIWMHGLGADANDFVPIVKELDLNACPAIRFVFPNAPTMPVTINGGYVMRAWYDIVGTDIAKREDEKGLRSSQAEIEKLIAREIARGIPANRIILAGFSQGCAMTLQTITDCP